MARLNDRPSYRASTIASSRYASATPGITSDQENQDPSAIRMSKGKGKERASGASSSRMSLPTPTSGSSNGDARGQKRKRTEIPAQEEEEEEVEEEDEQEEDSEAAMYTKFNKYFDPMQSTDLRRDLKKRGRALARGFNENKRELLYEDDGTGLNDTIHRANRIFKSVKQTNDATLDSRLLVDIGALASKKTAKLVLGNNSTGVDVDEFLSKCITYMRNGGPLSRDAAAPSSSRRRRTNADDSDEEDDDVAEGLDWDLFGRNVCFPNNSRPPVPSFLLGPLSVEKKQRTQTQRRARNAKDNAGREARPEALSKDDLHQSDENGLTAICTRIQKQLSKHVRKAQQTMTSAGFTSIDQLATERGRAMLRKVRISTTGGVGLFDFVINPRSFGQTVENLFYVSFLIKEGAVGIENDDDGLPTIVLGQASTVEQQRKNKSSKHQAVFSLDYGTWQDLIEAFDVQDAMIPHREEDVEAPQVGQRGWYA